VYLLCLEPVNDCCSSSNSDKETAGLTSDKTGGCFIDDASAALGIELVSQADAASAGNDLIQDRQCGKECSIVQGRLARGPVDRARYIVVDGSNGTMFACSRCGKQYIHRKSLNKHWNDKHSDNTLDRGNCLTSSSCSGHEPHESLHDVVLVQCPSDGKHVALSCSPSVMRSAVRSHAVSSPTYSAVPVAASQQKTYHNMSRNQMKHKSTIGHSVLWHSLSAIHSNEESDLNSFCYTPMPAHTGGCYSGRESFLNEIFSGDDCQVLDLSAGSSAVYELSPVPAPDEPIDLSVKSRNVCSADSEKAALPLHGSVKTASKSALSCCKEMSAADALVLNKSERVGGRLARFCGSTKDRKCTQSDSVTVLRHLRSGISASATKQSNVVDCSSGSAVASVTIEPKLDCTKLKLTGKYLQLANSVRIKNTLTVPAEISDDLATPEETHEYFGGMSRGGNIRCKKCDFSATSMLLFSRHVARHVNKLDILSGKCDSVQNECNYSVDELEDKFFVWLGLQRTDDADVDSGRKSSGRCCYAADDILEKDENLEGSSCKEIANDISDFATTEIQANGFGSHCDDESGPQKKNFNNDCIQQKRGGGYRRGLGLTTTESRDAAGRSWRRRRLRTCERCGYVTDNVTTLKRHEVKHGALGMYRCKLCDYTVNQQHVLEYHMQNVHGPSRQTGPSQLKLFRITDTPLIDNVFSEHSARNAASLTGDGHKATTLSKNLLETANTGDSAVGRGSGVITCSSSDVKVHDIHSVVTTNSMQKVIGKNVFASVTLARRNLLDAFGLQVGRGVCVRCGFRSLSTVKIKRHMLRHPRDHHACSLCLHTSLTARLLLKHTEKQHADCSTGFLAKKVYHCLECPFLAASPDRLQCHTQLHGAKLRHVCGKCSYSADRANLIAQHRRVHVPGFTAMKKRRWLHCGNCPFTTTNKGNLINHKRGHSAVNCRYVCSLCSFGTHVANVAFGHQQLHSCIR